MDPERARQLLQQERERIEALLADLSPQSEGEDDPGDEGSETLYQEEFDATRAEDLRASSPTSNAQRRGSPRAPTGARS